jgi:hydroxypyruvate isomerase
MGYRGTVGLEAWASGDSEQALARFRAALTGSQAPGSRGDRQ